MMIRALVPGAGDVAVGELVAVAREAQRLVAAQVLQTGLEVRTGVGVVASPRAR